MADILEILKKSNNILPGHATIKPMKVLFQELADYVDADSLRDVYGSGEYIQNFESTISEFLGKESGVFMPSGTMSQQIALRIWVEKSQNFTVAMHPKSHPEFAEHAGYLFLHNIKRIQFGGPEFLSGRLLTKEDFMNISQKPGVVLIELPFRPLGGQLPEWESLVEMTTWLKENNIPVHLDGARLWQSGTFYNKTLAEITALFDSVYVSFYKDIGGLNGSMLLGSKQFITEAKVWQRRHGGNVYSQSANVVSAKMMFEKNMPRMEALVLKAKEIASIFNEFDEIEVSPNPPHVNMFQLFIRGDIEKLNKKNLELAEESGTFIYYGLGNSEVPGIGKTEIHCWGNSLQFDISKLRPFIEKLLD